MTHVQANWGHTRSGRESISVRESDFGTSLVLAKDYTTNRISEGTNRMKYDLIVHIRAMCPGIGYVSDL